MTNFFPKIKAVSCNNITFAYHCMTDENVQTFSFENDEVQLQRLLLTNFIDVYLVDHYTLTIPVSETTTDVKERLETFMLHFGNCKYIAILDLTENFSDSSTAVIHLITDTSAQLDLTQLSTLWGDVVAWHISPFDEVLSHYNEALHSVKEKHSEYLFTSELQEPKTLHNSRAFSYLDKKDIINCDWQNSYKLVDANHGEVYVYEYVNI